MRRGNVDGATRTGEIRMDTDLGLVTSLPPGQEEEIAFWRHELRGNGIYPEVVKTRLSAELRYSEYPLALFMRLERELEKRPLKVLEVGSGPLSTLAYGVTTGQLDVVAIDVLAKQYKLLLEDLKIRYPVVPIAVAGEVLGNEFEPNSFDCAFARNSLDHTRDLSLTFQNMCRLVRPGGYIYLNHAVREGSFNKWSPSHVWDLDLGQNGGIIASRQGGPWLEVSRDLGLTTEYLVYSGSRFGRVLEIAFRKA
jgi:SAM-dependent methyltransferase